MLKRSYLSDAVFQHVLLQSVRPALLNDKELRENSAHITSLTTDFLSSREGSVFIRDMFALALKRIALHLDSGKNVHEASFKTQKELIAYTGYLLESLEAFCHQRLSCSTVMSVYVAMIDLIAYGAVYRKQTLSSAIDVLKSDSALSARVTYASLWVNHMRENLKIESLGVLKELLIDNVRDEISAYVAAHSAVGHVFSSNQKMVLS